MKTAYQQLAEMKNKKAIDKIYLVGVNHSCQSYRNDKPESIRFLKYLKTIATSHAITCICEEFNEVAVKIQKGEGSTAKMVADDLKIKHIYCDPDCEERIRIGIKTVEDVAAELGIKSNDIGLTDNQERISAVQRLQYRQRETHWMNTINEKAFGVVLFIVGSAHIFSFNSLLNNLTNNSSILLERFDENL